MNKFSSFFIKITAFSLVLSFAVLSFAYTGKLLYDLSPSEDITVSSLNDKKISVIIDAGHGGEDGGAVCKANGILEKDLNLYVARTVSDLLEASGFNVIMTRNDDVLLYDPDSKGTKKSQDLKNRLMFTVNDPDSDFVSIHMNTFPREQYSGLQVFYSPNDERSKKLADLIQSNTLLSLQTDNDRQTKRANSNIYILWRAKVPAVLIECGFLSNPEEAELLSTEVYRKKLATVIYSSICTYLNEENLNQNNDTLKS